jgi:hypothetical protein
MNPNLEYLLNEEVSQLLKKDSLLAFSNTQQYILTKRKKHDKKLLA